MREYDAHRPGPVDAGPVPAHGPEVAPAPMDLTVGEAILEAAELHSGVPDQRAVEDFSADARSEPGEDGRARMAEPVCRDDHGRATAERDGTAEEVMRSHG